MCERESFEYMKPKTRVYITHKNIYLLLKEAVR